MNPAPVKPPDPSVDELKAGFKRYLYPRLIIGAVLTVLALAYILWPR